MTRLRARAPRGERVIGQVPHKRWESVTLLASITTSGMGAAMVLDGALARESFDAFVEQLLLPTLAPFFSNDWPWKTDPSKGKGPARLEDIK